MKRDVESIRRLILTDGYVERDHDARGRHEGQLFHWDASQITDTEAKSVLLLLVNAFGLRLVRRNGEIQIEDDDQ